jgi:hypothetical protein
MKSSLQLLLQLISLFSVSSLVGAEEQIVLDAGLDGTLNHIQYTSGFVEPSSPRHVWAKKKAMDALIKPDEDSDEWTVEHPRWRLLHALHSYYRYKTRYVKQLNSFQKSFEDLPIAMRKVCIATFQKHQTNFAKGRPVINRLLHEL